MRKFFLLLLFLFTARVSAQTVNGFDGTNLYWNNGVAQRTTLATIPFSGPVGPVWDEGGAVYNVRAYGAVGNGSSSDQLAIQAALNAAETYGGIVYFPQSSGRYCTTAALSITAPVIIQGPSQYTQVGPCTTGVAYDIFDVNSSNVYFWNITVNANSSGPVYKGVNFFSGYSNVGIFNSTVENAGQYCVDMNSNSDVIIHNS